MNNRQHFAGTSNKGFSLLELLLVLVIVMLLFGAAVFEYSSIGRGVSLSEGAIRMESLFRFARSEAERSGKMVRIRFGPIESEPRNLSAQTNSPNTVEIASTAEDYPLVEWEPNPVEMPGQFKSLANSAFFTEGINEIVKIESVQLSGLDAQMARINNETDFSVETPTDTPPEQVEYTLPILHFFPDGSCNSARIQIADINPENLNKSIVELIGYTGTVKHQFIEILPEQTAGPDTNEVLEAEASLGQ